MIAFVAVWLDIRSSLHHFIALVWLKFVFFQTE